jgi:hypothetical protein
MQVSAPAKLGKRACIHPKKPLSFGEIADP